MTSTPNILLGRFRARFTKARARADSSLGDLSLGRRVALAAGLSLVLWLALAAAVWLLIG